jgi:hypothetical protein
VSFIYSFNSSSDAWAYFKDVKPPFKPFRDAINGPCEYVCTILDCLRGLQYAIEYKFIINSMNKNNRLLRFSRSINWFQFIGRKRSFNFR